MRWLRPWVMLTALAFACTSAGSATRRDVVTIRNGDLELRAVLWRPNGRGPFPAVLFNHGGGPGQKSPAFHSNQEWYKHEPDVLGPLFARHGYVFLYVFRRGAGLSAGQGTWSGDLLDAEREARGVEAMNRLQVRLLETDLMSDALAALALLRAQPDVDPMRIAVAGHSFGGSLTLFLAERERSVRAVITFAAAAASWPRSPELQARLLEAARRIDTPVLFIHAANDYSVTPGELMAAERKRTGKPHQLEIYPPFGKSQFEGHNFIDLDTSVWERDVFSFLKKAGL